MNIPVFTHQFRKSIGRYALYLAIFSFIVHLILHLFRAYIPGGMEAALLRDPTSAIYTPFSILLVYEAYLMIYYLRRSTTIYIAKQYEVIALILIRGLFKDMAVLDLKVATWSSQHNLEFAADIILVVMAFYLVYWFYRLSGTYKYADFEAMEEKEIGPKLKQVALRTMITTPHGSPLPFYLVEIQADVILKGTRVDGIYSADPEKDPTATKFETLSFKEVYDKGLNVMDMTAFTLSKENELPIIVFDMNTEGNLMKVIEGAPGVGTIVKN